MMMKVIQLNSVKPTILTEKLLGAILNRDFNAFKATSKQFIHNNKTYFTGGSGMIA
jgi:hypothetical protein